MRLGSVAKIFMATQVSYRYPKKNGTVRIPCFLPSNLNIMDHAEFVLANGYHRISLDTAQIIKPPIQGMMP